MSVARSLCRPSCSNKGRLAVGPSTRLQRRWTSSAPAAQKVIFSGIQPSGTIHLGNLLGALQNWRELARSEPPETAIYYSLVGLHAITLPKDPVKLERERREMMAALLAMGLGGKGGREVLYCQDMVPEHAELAWILNCSTPMGKLQRMTTWKGKIAVQKNHATEEDVSETDLNLGLFAYPVLQAADILLYKATHVPVGEDQQQHLELSRDIATTFNAQFANRKPFFPAPLSLITPSKRILSLRNPLEKMSKSSPVAASRIELTDSTSTIFKKLRGAVTDSTSGPITFDPLNRPGVANLLTILASCGQTNTTPEREAERLRDISMRDLKEEVAQSVEGLIGPIRGELERLLGEEYLADQKKGGKGGVRMKEEGYLREVALEGAERAREKASVTLAEVKKLVGLSSF